ncbi:unnamed protein product, partial [Protopolystoma xenopodis]
MQADINEHYNDEDTVGGQHGEAAGGIAESRGHNGIGSLVAGKAGGRTGLAPDRSSHCRQGSYSNDSFELDNGGRGGAGSQFDYGNRTGAGVESNAPIRPIDFVSSVPGLAPGTSAAAMLSEYADQQQHINFDRQQRMRDEFCVNLYKFISVLEETWDTLLGAFHLSEAEFLPEKTEDEGDFLNSLRPDPSGELSCKLRRLLSEWGQGLSILLEHETYFKVLLRLDEPRPINTGPLEEVDYWRLRNKTLTAISDALHSRDSQRAIKAWRLLNPEGHQYTRYLDVKALMLEAKDNT